MRQIGIKPPPSLILRRNAGAATSWAYTMEMNLAEKHLMESCGWITCPI